MNLTGMLPRSWVGNFHNVVLFISKHVAPSIGFSSGLVAKLLPSDDKPVIAAAATDDRSEEDKKLDKAKESIIMKYVFAEQLSGVSDDALLFLRRTGAPQPWGSWGDFDTGIPLLLAQESAARRSNVEPLKVQVFYAESDRMTGVKGKVWFDKCWNDALIGDDGRTVGFESEVCKGTNHDGILDAKHGVLGRWLDCVVASW